MLVIVDASINMHAYICVWVVFGDSMGRGQFVTILVQLQQKADHHPSLGKAPGAYRHVDTVADICIRGLKTGLNRWAIELGGAFFQTRQHSLAELLLNQLLRL
jgi:hypothetical protein